MIQSPVKRSVATNSTCVNFTGAYAKATSNFSGFGCNELEQLRESFYKTGTAFCESFYKTVGKRTYVKVLRFSCEDTILSLK